MLPYRIGGVPGQKEEGKRKRLVPLLCVHLKARHQRYFDSPSGVLEQKDRQHIPMPQLPRELAGLSSR